MTQRNQATDINLQKQIAFAKLKSSFFLIILILSVFASLYFFINLRASNEELESTKIILESQNRQLFALKDSVSYFLSLTDSLIKNEKLRKESQRIIKLSDNVGFLIGIYGLKPEEEKFNEVKNYFLEQGYTVFVDYKLNERPSWLSLDSTVLYYDESSKEKAKKIASDLEEITGKKFYVSRGAGLGVKKGQEKFTFYVHYIG